MHRPDIGYLVGLSLLPGIGPARFYRLLDRCGDPERAWRASERDLTALGVEARILPTLLEKRKSISIEQEMEKLRRAEVTVLSVYDPEYPLRLKEIYNPPALLYMKGEITRQDDQSVGVVGTRAPSVYGRELTARIVPELVSAGLTIISGMARGVAPSPSWGVVLMLSIPVRTAGSTSASSSVARWSVLVERKEYAA
jgi:DNA processing protein